MKLVRQKRIMRNLINFLIPPDRSRFSKYSFDFPLFQRAWLDPVFAAFPNLAIHEAVHDELITLPVQAYIKSKIESRPKRWWTCVYLNLSLGDHLS